MKFPKIVIVGIVFALVACGCQGVSSQKRTSVKTGVVLDLSARSVAGDTGEEEDYRKGVRTIHRGACVSLFSCEWGGQANPENELVHQGLRLCLLSDSHYLQGVGLGVLGLGAYEVDGVLVGGLVGGEDVDGVLVGGLVGGREVHGIMIGLVTGLWGSRVTLSEGGGLELGAINLGAGYWVQVGGINSAIRSLLQVGIYNVTGCNVLGDGYWGGQVGLINVQVDEEHYQKINLIQLGLLNVNLKFVSDEYKWGQLWQFGLLNRTASGWWLPLSNCGF